MPDRPITIASGSPLTIRSRRGCLRRLGNRALVATHPEDVITSVVVKLARGEPVIFPFDDEACDISLTFGDIRLVVQTDPEGRHLRIVTLGSMGLLEHFRKVDGGFESLAEDAIIQDLRILKAGVAQTVEQPGSDYTKIVIHNK